MNKYFKKVWVSKSKISHQSGMTLIELLVVLAIFLIVSGITIFDYGKFNSTVSLQNLADDMALSIRQAQSYAIGVHNTTSVNCLSGSSFCGGYGIHFTAAPATPTSNPLSGSDKSFVIFADVNSNRLYDVGTSTTSTCKLGSNGTECVNLLKITSADHIISICPNGTNCTSNGYVDILFNRPNPDAYIYMNGVSSTIYSYVNIKIQDIRSQEVKTVTISNTGQISVSAK